MSTYPVVFNVNRPDRFDRQRVGVRLVLVGLLWLLVTTPLVIITHAALPLIAAIVISNKDGRRFIEEDAERFTAGIRWYLSLLAYITFLTDRFPLDGAEELVTLEVQPQGSPTVGSALSRLVLSIPSAFVLTILAIAGAVVWAVAVISVLTRESYSERLYNFQLGIMRWHARLLAYHASLVDQYPPFAFDQGTETAPPAA